MSAARVLLCDQCGKEFRPDRGEFTRLSCGHDVCYRHPLNKNERGEIQCSHGCGSVYIKEILS